MIRGELSNRPSAICGIDYRVLLDVQFPYGWFSVMIPKLLIDMRFERTMRRAMPFKPGAKSWLEVNWERRFASISVGQPYLAPAIDMILGDYIAEQHHFETVQDFRQWLRCSPQVFRVYTDDPQLLGLEDVTRSLPDWTEKV